MIDRTPIRSVLSFGLQLREELGVLTLCAKSANFFDDDAVEQASAGGPRRDRHRGGVIGRSSGQPESSTPGNRIIGAALGY